MSVVATFKNSGTYTPYGWKTELIVQVPLTEEDSFYLRTGRDTALAGVIEKFIIRKKFLWSGKRKLRKKLTERQWHLLSVLEKAGPKYYWLYSKTLRERKPMKWLEAQLLWRVL